MKICTCRKLAPGLERLGRELAISEDPANASVGACPSRAAISVGRRWLNGRNLNVGFLDGSPTQRVRVQPYFHRWEQYANITFTFVANPVFTDLRVSFDGKGSWSYIGTDALAPGKDEPTMVLGWLDDGTDEAEYRRVVLHEVGHVLGFFHEDQQPAVAIKWDIPKVMDYYTGPPNNWSVADVYAQVIDKVKDPSVDDTVFDPHSIMAYPVPAELTLDGVGVPLNDDLSPLDMQFAARMYPDGTLPRSVVPNLPLGGPQMIFGIGAFFPTVDFRLEIPAGGTYRIWTSQLNGPIALYRAGAMGTPLIDGSQHIRGVVSKGDYIVRVGSADVTENRNIRIHARRLD